MAHDFTWPKPWLLELYERAVEEGCIRIKLRSPIGSPEAETEWKSFKGSFNRLRRRADNANLLMDSRFQFVSLKNEPLTGKVLIIYSALPDDQLLPSIEAVDGKRELPQPIGSQPKETPEEEPDDFDATAHVAKLLDKIDFDDDEEGSDGLK